MYIDGKFVESKTNDWIDVHNPATNEVGLLIVLSNNENLKKNIVTFVFILGHFQSTKMYTRRNGTCSGIVQSCF